jgi:hypothetical protein
MNKVLLKIGSEKLYDKVHWTFLQQELLMKVFDPKWCRWIQDFVSRGSAGIKVDDYIGHYFHTKKGLAQDDLMSPFNF